MRSESTLRGELRDAALREAWRLVVLSMIFALMLLACGLAYQTLFALVAADWARAGTTLAVALLAGGGVAWLCAHRRDLVEM